MKDEFVIYPLALRLKALGYDKPCLKLWEKTMLFTSLVDPSEFKKIVSERYCPAPTWQSAFKWFRENHGLKFGIREDSWNDRCEVRILNGEEYEDIEVSGWEEAQKVCLERLCEIVEK